MVERYIHRRGPDYYSNPYLLAEAKGRSWAGFIGSLVSRELITVEDVGPDGFFKAASLNKVLYFQNNQHLVAALCAHQLSERSTLLQRARMLETTVEKRTPLESSPWPFALKLREAASSLLNTRLTSRWLAPVGLLIAGVSLSLQFLKPPSASAQTPIPTPTPKAEISPTRVPPIPVMLDELTKKRAEAVAVQLPNLDDLIQDAVRISAEQLKVSVDDLDPATFRAVNRRVQNVIEGIANLAINGAVPPDQSHQVFEQVLSSELVENQLRVTSFRHMADDQKEAELENKSHRADLTINLLKRTSKYKSLQAGLIYLMSQGFVVEDLDYAVTNAEDWGLIDKLDGPTLVALISEFNQSVDPKDSIVGRRSIMRALENKHLEVLNTETGFLDRLTILITSLASE